MGTFSGTLVHGGGSRQNSEGSENKKGAKTAGVLLEFCLAECSGPPSVESQHRSWMKEGAAASGVRVVGWPMRKPNSSNQKAGKNPSALRLHQTRLSSSLMFLAALGCSACRNAS